MRLTAIVSMLLVTGAGAWAGPNAVVPQGSITACIELSDARIATHLLPLARQTASQIFARIGVAIRWHPGPLPPRHDATGAALPGLAWRRKRDSNAIGHLHPKDLTT